MKNKIFICIFFCFCLIPLLTMGFSNSSNNAANQILNEAPSFIDNTGKININYLSEFSNYFDDHIGLRNQLITAEHRITAAVFSESSEEKVILGKDGWLFYKETLDDYQRTNLLTDRELCSVTKGLYLMQEYLENNDINFVFTVVPNKNSIYNDKMPSYYKQGTSKSNLEKLAEKIEATNINYIDLLSVFKNTNKFLYRKTDSHWTNECAGLAADIILKAVGKNEKKYFGSETDIVSAQTGDLYEMIYPSKKDNDIDIVYKNKFSFEYTKPIRSVEDNFIKTTSNEKEGSLYVFRDSFGNTLYPYLAENFAKSTFTRLIPYNLTLPVTEGADTVVIEIVERNINWLLSKPPVFPAPKRELNLNFVNDITKNANISISENNEISEYIKLEGTIKNLRNDDDIFIKAGQQTFEATPTGSNTFVAYLPSSADLSNIEILTYK